MAKKEQFHPVVEELIVLIKKNKWEKAFETAIKKANSFNVPLLGEVTSLDKYLVWINKFLYWIPSENIQGKNIYDHLCAFYFILDQESLLKLQNAVIPHDVAPPLTTLSAWMVKYANAMGEFLDTPESLTPESEQFQTRLQTGGSYFRPNSHCFSG